MTHHSVDRERYYKELITLACFVLVGIVGIVDYCTGYELGVSLFYLIPIALITWSSGIVGGIILSVIGAFSWTFFSGMTYSNSIVPYLNFSMRLVHFFIVAVVLSQLLKSLEKEKKLARKDFLTNVANSAYFHEQAALEIEKSKRYTRPLTIAYVDCDNFKQVNDISGHKKGDTLLQLVARTVQHHLRTTDMVARMGGDEFIVLLPETGMISAREAITRVYTSLNDTMAHHGFSITFSIGVATFESVHQSLDDMIQKADALMYQAKKEGKNKVVYNTF
ncbi:MAG: diguanylate cyclase [Candidatus Omnitrophica bacterium]|nr:diguanylate cyclase [Candidatus Omnitrophota bacterium]